MRQANGCDGEWKINTKAYEDKERESERLSTESQLAEE